MRTRPDFKKIFAASRRFIDWLLNEPPGDDWSDLLADPFIPDGYKNYLVEHFPEKFDRRNKDG